MGRRHKLDIYADILRLATDGTRTTKLVYQANTNFTNIKRYLEALSEKGLIMFNDGHPHTTERGSEFLEKYEELMHVFNSHQADEIGEDPNEDEGR
ncbi:MAG: winged helix-turn-helix domain-containing protein [Candidatus Bathyarchaeota archaeon]|nr:winged helix-turn-helix domain-containing protein [Candidatus Bathyarchaeota archaeon]